MTAKYRAVIFDLFGTLVDFSPLHLQEALERVADVLGVSTEAFKEAEYVAFAEVGNSPDPGAVLSRACEIIGYPPTPEALRTALELWRGFTLTWLSPRPGVADAIAELSARDMKIGLISNCDGMVPLVWPRSDLAELIDVPVFSSTEQVMKPDPAIYELATKRLGCAPSECLFVGDGSSTELTGAVGAGMAAVQLLVDGEGADVGLWLQRQEWNGRVLRRFSEVVEAVLDA